MKPGDVALRIPLSCAFIEPDDDNNKDSWTGKLANQLLDQKDSFYTCALPVPPSTPARGDWPEQLLEEFQNSAFCEEIDHQDLMRIGFLKLKNFSVNNIKSKEVIFCSPLMENLELVDSNT